MFFHLNSFQNLNWNHQNTLFGLHAHALRLSGRRPHRPCLFKIDYWQKFRQCWPPVDNFCLSLSKHMAAPINADQFRHILGLLGQKLIWTLLFKIDFWGIIRFRSISDGILPHLENWAKYVDNQRATKAMWHIQLS